MQTIYAILTILSITTLFGVYLLSLVLRNKQTPKGFAVMHGLFAFVGVGLLIGYWVNTEPGPWLSILIFLLAAFGGFVLFYKDITGVQIPKWLGVFHGLTAVAGLITLIIYFLNR